MEALRVQNDALQVKMQRLEVENARLHDEHPDESMRMEAKACTQVEYERLQAEADQLRRLYEQAIGDLQEERMQTGEATADLAGQLRNATESKRDDLKTIVNLRRENAQLAKREMTTTPKEKLTEAEAALTRVTQDTEFQRLRAVTSSARNGKLGRRGCCGKLTSWRSAQRLASPTPGTKSRHLPPFRT